MKSSGSSRCCANSVFGGQSLQGLIAQSCPARNTASGALHWYWATLVQSLVVPHAPSSHTPCPQFVPAPSHVPAWAAQSSGERSMQLPSAKQHAPTPASQGSSRQLVPAPANSRPAVIHENASAWLQFCLKQHAPVPQGSSAQSSPGRNTPPRAAQAAASAAGTHC